MGGAMSREIFAREALAQIPKILTQQDRNPHSPTYGCFDRNFWHYKIVDFPSGMSQEFVWPLALAMTTEMTGNPWFGKPALKDWVEAGILFAARSAHPDGSCDDYFPFEKAGGAAAFSLLACVESYQLLGLQNQEMLEFFHRRADWLAHHHESGRLTNHQALIVLCLERVGELLATGEWDKAKTRRLKRVLEWQNEEGWFQEYEGADPGYHTLTVGLLAQIHTLKPSEELSGAIRRAVAFAREFVHPDGSFGGEYTSRNTYNFFPHGFELAGAWLPEALEINPKIASGLEAGLGACYADDHIVGHHAWSYLLAYRHWVADRPAPKPKPDGRTHFTNAGLVVDRRAGSVLYLALNKGGSFRFFRHGKLVASDSGVSLRVRDGKKVKTAVSHLVGKYGAELEDDRIEVSGAMGWAKHKAMTPFRAIALRMVMLTVGRFFPNLIRKVLQKMLITGKSNAPFRMKRTIAWQQGGLEVSDEIVPETNWAGVVEAGIGGFQTSIYVVMSRTFQQGQLQRWHNLGPELEALKLAEPLKVVRLL